MSTITNNSKQNFDTNISDIDIYYSHSFSVKVAVDCGIDAGPIFNHIIFWIKQNRINGKNFHEGKTWMYDTFENFLKYMPYLTHKRIEVAIKSLVEKGYLLKGNFNKNKFDRTNWYTLNNDNSNFNNNDSYRSPRGLQENSNKDYRDSYRSPPDSYRSLDHISDNKNTDDKNIIIKDDVDDDVLEKSFSLESSNKQDPPQKRETADITYTKTNGEKKSLPQDEIFRFFINQARFKKKSYSTEIVKQAINSAQNHQGPINNILKYIEGICKTLEQENIDEKNNQTKLHSHEKVFEKPKTYVEKEISPEEQARIDEIRQEIIKISKTSRFQIPEKNK